MAGVEAERGDGLGELKHNLQVSFSRMREDIHYNRQQVEDLLTANKALVEQIVLLKAEIGELKKRPGGIKAELMRGIARNQKGIIKQRIIGYATEARYCLPELKEIIVDDKNYCSKASFYRYLEELRLAGKLDFANIEGREIVVVGSGAALNPKVEGNSTPKQAMSFDRFV